MLALGDRLVQRNEAVENICNKYLTLRKRKNEQVLMLRKWIEILQVKINKKEMVIIGCTFFIKTECTRLLGRIGKIKKRTCER